MPITSNHRGHFGRLQPAQKRARHYIIAGAEAGAPGRREVPPNAQLDAELVETVGYPEGYPVNLELRPAGVGVLAIGCHVHTSRIALAPCYALVARYCGLGWYLKPSGPFLKALAHQLRRGEVIIGYVATGPAAYAWRMVKRASRADEIHLAARLHLQRGALRLGHWHRLSGR